MKNKYNSSVSLEKFSAYLDGNLSSTDMERMSTLISNDDVLLDLMKENLEIEDAEDYYSDSALESESIMLDEKFELPNIEEISSEQEFIPEFSDIWLDTEASNSIDEEPHTDSDGLFSPNTLENPSQTDPESTPELVESSNNSGHMKEKVNYGYKPNHSESTFDLNIYQGNQPSCAVRSQEIILRDYGISIPQEELIKFATENGWYSPDPEHGGTPRDATGNILDAMGVETKRYDNATIYDIISELRAGHRVIVSVDANELWIKNEPSLYKRIFGEVSNRVVDKLDNLSGIQGANHALIVAGVNVNPKDPSDMKVILIDSGSGDVCIEYKFSAFQKAWDDSHCHMVTTTQPAPFQYNYRTHQMEPSNFKSDFMPSMVNLPAGLHNQFELPDTYFEKYGDLTPEYSWNHIAPFWENWENEDHAEREHLVASSVNSSHEEDDSYSSEETEEDGTSYENDGSVGSSSEEDSTTHSCNEEDDLYDSDSDHMDNDSSSEFDDDSDFQ